MNSHTRFIEAWNQSQSLQEVANKIDRTLGYVKIRGNWLINLGYDLKQFN